MGNFLELHMTRSLLIALLCCTACTISEGKIPCTSNAQCASGLVCGIDGFCETASTCPLGEKLCGGVCTNINTAANCGACGTSCTGSDVCSNGVCASACSANLTACSTTDGGTICADLERDSANCHACGNACSSNEICASGACEPLCAAPLTTCPATSGAASYCADTRNDPAHCGACGNACGDSELCSAGKCVTSCASPKVQCTAAAGGLYCADPLNDPANCGGCNGTGGVTCGAHQLCVHGACANECASPLTTCGQSDGSALCIDTNGDPNNCGGCAGAGGHVCQSGEVCALGKCTTACLSPLATCSTPDGGVSCVDTLGDPNSCGGCPGAGGLTCAANEVCAQGTCAPACSDPLQVCRDEAGITSCIDTARDPNNCGGCASNGGKVCAANEFCAQGNCAPACSAPLVVCSDGNGGTSCIDTAGDPNNCGGCANAGGAVCGANQVCAQAACVDACVSPLAQCSDGNGNPACVDTMNDPQNCGGCGNPDGGTNICTTGNSCTNGVCEPICGALAFCSEGNGHFACADIINDPNHCGSCGNACALNEICQKGLCGYADSDDAYISPGYPLGSATRARATNYTIASPPSPNGSPPVIFYSLDGGIPLDGGALVLTNGSPPPGVFESSSPASVLLDNQTVTWFAYRGDDGHTDPVHQFNHRSTANPDFAGIIVEGVVLSNSSPNVAFGPVINVVPGAPLHVQMNYSWWRDANDTINQGGCPGCIDFFAIALIDNQSDPVVYCPSTPNQAGQGFSNLQSTTADFFIVAPTTPGVYPLRAFIGEWYNCEQSAAPGGEDIGVVIVNDVGSVTNLNPARVKR